MESRIEHIEGKRLIGLRSAMSLAENTTPLLWRSFMTRRHEVKYRTTSEYISMQVYDGAGKNQFSPTTVFEKWAVVEVSSHDFIPEGMEGYTLHGGTYAVFIHKGPANLAPKTMQYIFGTWLPNSDYELDDREHFEVLQEGYDPSDINAQEEFWIPIK